MNSNLSKTFVRLEISHHGSNRKCLKVKDREFKYFLLSWFILVIAHMLTLFVISHKINRISL